MIKTPPNCAPRSFAKAIIEKKWKADFLTVNLLTNKQFYDSYVPMW